MIASVSGTVQSRRPDHVVIECGGVGYRLSVSSRTLDQIPAAGQSATLLSHLVLRDDAIQLYGFAAEAERDLFLRLVSVSGVGPKMALAALSGSSASELRKAIASGDAKRFQVVPGIGRKTAERVIVELREAIADELQVEHATSEPDDERGVARDGLVALGYDAAEAEAMLDAVLVDGAEPSRPEELIAAALRTAVKAA
jgi:Holliday junction DNA helicase RuvA